MIRKYGLFAAWVVAAVATLASLFFSEIVLIDPCSISWFQRICLYPFAVILGRAAWQGFYGIASYALPITLFGLFLSIIQIIDQETNWLHFISSCGIKADIGLGPITIPMLTCASFVLINALLLIVWRISKKGAP